MPYREALEFQYELMRLRQAGEIEDTLLLLEHPPTITLGRRSAGADLLTDPATLQRRGVEIVNVDRGGEITYHGPGQLVGYPILDLRAHGQDLHLYLRQIEQVLIDALLVFGLNGERIPGLTGIWIDGKKIAALGIKVSKWVTMHGFALNISSDLAPFRQDIVPCGIRDRDVTSLAELRPGLAITRPQVEEAVITAFSAIFQVTPNFISREV